MISSILNDGVEKSSLHVAALMGQVDVMRRLIEEGRNVEERSGDGKTPLHYATIGGGRAAMEYLIGRGASPNVYDNNNLRPIHYAILRMKSRK